MVGVLDKKGQSQFGQDIDDAAFVPVSTFQQKLQGGLKNLIAVSRKGMLRGDILIDDGEHNIKDWTEEGPVNGAILFDAPWNRDVPSVVNRKYVRRAHGWDEIPKIVEGIEYLRSNRIIIDD